MENIRELAQDLFEYTRALRRDFHKHPELGFHETRTSSIVAKELSSFGLSPQIGVGETGVVAILKGKRSGPVVLVRADMDALPIVEETGVPYSSTNKGVMHACGHDAHTAILLAVAKIMCEYQDQIAGTVKFMFQPSEEGMGGAEKMISAGVLENPKVDFALALHVWNEKPIGWIGISNGPAMAGAEIFKVKIRGKGCHGAVPHLAVDPILASAQVISAVQGIVARNVAPLQTAVVSICTIHGGEAFNVIPPYVEMTGTIRTFEPTVRTLVIERFKSTVNSVAEGMGCQVDIELNQLTPATINHHELSKQVQNVARTLFPDQKVDDSNYVTMGSEDFSYVMEKIPGCFMFIGSANPSKGLNAAHHHPMFDIDEEALKTGSALLVGSILEILK